MNASVCGFTVDALWREQRVAAELDGHAGHSSAAAIVRDRRRDLRLRSAGLQVLRYTWAQITQEPGAVASDLRRALLAQ
jgi:very-short-patch-repair endonuclease